MICVACHAYLPLPADGEKPKAQCLRGLNLGRESSRANRARKKAEKIAAIERGEIEVPAVSPS